MENNEQMTLMMDFLVRCRQAHLFTNPGSSSGAGSLAGSSTPSPSVQSSPFQRRSASRTRVLSTLTGEPSTYMANDSTRSRANSSFTSYDNRMIGMERQRPKSPFRILGNQGNGGVGPTNRLSPLTASNHLFSTPAPHQFTTPSANPYQSRNRDESPSYLRATPLNHGPHQNGDVTSSIRAQTNSKSATPLYARIGSAMTHPESHVCECLLAALLGIETRLFTPIHRKMTITSTASLSTSHIAVAQRVLSLANVYLVLSHKEPMPPGGTVSSALLASIRYILGDYTADIDSLRRRKNLKFHQILPVVDKWHEHLGLLAKAHKLRSIGQLELLENLYVLHRSYCHDEERKKILDKVLDYTMGVFCHQMLDWMTVGEAPADKWMIQKDGQTGELALKKVPIFMSELDAKILLEIGKSLPNVEHASDEDLAAIDKATNVVRAALSPKTIFDKELTPLLGILRDVVCGCVMRMVVSMGRLKEHVRKAASFFFLQDPRFMVTLYNIIKEASFGLRVGSASLSRQTVSSALAAALEATTCSQNAENKKHNKLKFTLDAITSLGTTPNISSKMQFVQPLHPKYLPTMDLMKPIFQACDDEYEAIFHVIWSIDLARLSSQEAAAHLPEMHRFLVKNYSLRENAWCLLNMLSHVFFLINATLSRVRSHIAVQVQFYLARFLAAIDEKCVDLNDVIKEHRKFCRRIAVVVYVRNNEHIEHELASLLRVAFEAQEVVGELANTWNESRNVSK
uniref:Gamma-tubulin complex component n=1 Tax=Caenorhabditis japonica TaxID=281687 RepID=A0A8R1E193_CAEJA